MPVVAGPGRGSAPPADTRRGAGGAPAALKDWGPRRAPDVRRGAAGPRSAGGAGAVVLALFATGILPATVGFSPALPQTAGYCHAAPGPGKCPWTLRGCWAFSTRAASHNARSAIRRPVSHNMAPASPLTTGSLHRAISGRCSSAPQGRRSSGASATCMALSQRGGER
jgi:hypothetical protein